MPFARDPSQPAVYFSAVHRHNELVPNGKAPFMEQLPRVSIQYCDQCRWMLRATWCAQELLTTFQGQLGEVALIPGSGGIFEVRCDGVVLWSRKDDGGFPELKALKQRVRDQIAPGQSLGHSDA